MDDGVLELLLVVHQRRRRMLPTTSRSSLRSRQPSSRGFPVTMAAIRFTTFSGQYNATRPICLLSLLSNRFISPVETDR